MKGFEDIIKEQKSSMKTSLTICVSLFVAAGAVFFVRRTIALFFLLVAVLLAVSLYSMYSKFKAQIADIDVDEVAGEFISANSRYFMQFELTITDNYVIMERPAFKVYTLAKMEKFEVGIAGEMRKALFLTDFKGERHKIAETQKGDATQRDFDEAYECIRDYFNRRKAK